MAPSIGPDELALLEEQRDFLRRSLADLDREHAAGDLDDADLTTLRADYERRLAEVDSSLEGGASMLLPRAAPRGRRRTIAWVAAVVVVAIGAGLIVERMAGSRRPGETASGSIRQSSVARLAQAAQLAGEGKFAEALQTYDAVLDADPRNVEALSERGLLLVSLSDVTDRPALLTQGRLSIEEALRIDAHDPRALFYLGLALQLAGQDGGAADMFERALAEDPPAALRARIVAFQAAGSGSTTTVAP